MLNKLHETLDKHAPIYFGTKCYVPKFWQSVDFWGLAIAGTVVVLAIGGMLWDWVAA